MTNQREKPGITSDQLEAAVGVRPTYLSGGQIENFREGWAHHIFGSGQKAHYFRRNSFDNAVALCSKWAPVRWIYGAGNYPRCKTCEKALKARRMV